MHSGCDFLPFRIQTLTLSNHCLNPIFMQNVVEVTESSIVDPNLLLTVPVSVKKNAKCQFP